MIAFVYANRAEQSILQPVVDVARERNLEFATHDLSDVVKDIELDENLGRVYDVVYNKIDQEKTSVAVLVGDRREVMFAALAYFIKGVKIVQLASGDLSGKITLVDDYFRHLITVMTSLQVPFSQKSLERTESLMSCLNLKSSSKHFANPTLSNFDIEDITPPEIKDYDLILMHPQSLSAQGTRRDLQEIKNLITKDRNYVIILGNKDKNYEILYDYWENLEKLENISVHENLDKEKFISYLSNAQRFITNSSCSYYEAPLFLKEDQIVRVGGRNKGREIVRYSKEELHSAGKILDEIVGVQ
jgi:UDP-N-acetylglucosamine 2-epimerase